MTDAPAEAVKSLIEGAWRELVELFRQGEGLSWEQRRILGEVIADLGNGVPRAFEVCPYIVHRDAGERPYLIPARYIRDALRDLRAFRKGHLSADALRIIAPVSL
jgi:hypothetical protein